MGPSEIQAALYRHLGTGAPFIRALLEIGGVSEQALDNELSRSTWPSLDAVVPVATLVDELPDELCRKLLAVPVRRDSRTGTVDVAVVDPYDTHIADELAFHLRSQVRTLRCSLRSVEQALDRIDRGEYSSKVIVRKSRPAVAESDRPASQPPIPLLRKTSKDAEGPPRADDETVEVLGVRDIIDSMEGEGQITDELGQPVMPLRTSRAPRAPAVPRIGPSERTGRDADDSAPPQTSRGPFSPKAPVAPFPSIDGVLAALDKARTRDEVIEGLIAGMSTVALRVGAFAVKKNAIRGIACNRDLGESKSFREIEIPLDAPSVLGIAVTRGSYLGPVPVTPPHESLLKFMRGSSGEVAAVLVSVAGRPAVVLFADTLGDTMIATRRAEELGREASRAFSRILTESKTDRRSGT